MTDHLPAIDFTTQLLARTFQRDVMPMPFARDIFLIETHIAGLQYYQAKEIKEDLQPKVSLKLQREPHNAHDSMAIEVLTLDNIKLGYVPRHRNVILARLMDAGKLLVAELAEIVKDEVDEDDDYEYWSDGLSLDGYPDEIRLRILLRDI